MNERESRPRRVFVVVCDRGMGDAVEALPAFELLREHLSGAQLDAGYFRASQAPVFEMCPHVSEAVQLAGSGKEPWAALRGLAHNHKLMRRYDDVLFLYRTTAALWPLALAAKLAGARVLWERGGRYRDPRRHRASDFPQYVFLQIDASNLVLQSPLTAVKPLHLEVPDSDRRFAEAFFDRQGLGRRPVVIVNTESPPPPDWGIAKYAEVVNALVEDGVDVIINGGSDDQVQEFESVAGRLHPAVRLLDRPSPGRLAAVIAKCDLYLGAANGPTSVALAVGTAVALVVGPGESSYPGQGRIGPFWWPHDSGYHIISKAAWCRATMGDRCLCRPQAGIAFEGTMKLLGVWRPLKRARKRLLVALGAYRHRAESYPCLEAITVQDVLTAVREQLTSRRDAAAGLANVGVSSAAKAEAAR